MAGLNRSDNWLSFEPDWAVSAAWFVEFRIDHFRSSFKSGMAGFVCDVVVTMDRKKVERQ